MQDLLSNSNFRVWDRRDKKMIYVERRAPIALNMGHHQTTMVSIGRFDKNSNLIFELDILRVDGKDMIVRYNPTIAGFGASFLEGGTCPIPDDVEVVGNFFENPELMLSPRYGRRISVRLDRDAYTSNNF